MTTKIAIVNNKGGSTKTTTAVNLAGAYSIRFPKRRVLIVDTDGQGNVSVAFKVNVNNVENTVYDVFMGQAAAKDCIVNAYGNIDLIPANGDMNFLEFDLLQYVQSGHLNIDNIINVYFNMLSGKLEEIEKDYDLIIFDTPPEIKAVTSSVLSITDHVIIPYEPDTYAVKGVIDMIERIDKVKQDYNNKMSIAGIMAVKVRSNTNSHKAIMNKMMKWSMAQRIYYFQAESSNSVRYSDSITFKGVPAAIHGSSSRTYQKFAEVYQGMVEELIQANIIEGDE